MLADHQVKGWSLVLGLVGCGLVGAWPDLKGKVLLHEGQPGVRGGCVGFSLPTGPDVALTRITQGGWTCKGVGEEWGSPQGCESDSASGQLSWSLPGPKQRGRNVGSETRKEKSCVEKRLERV